MNKDLQEASLLISDTFKFIRESFGRVFRSKRRGAGMTQVQVARAARVRPETVSRLEAGMGNPTIKTLERMMKAVER